MKKYIITAILMALVLMFVAGCATQEAEPVPVEEFQEKQATEPKTTVKEPAPVQKEDPVEVKTEPALPTMNKKVAELLTKHQNRVTSLRYMYQDQTNKPEEWETWTDGSTMHVKLREMDNVKGDVYVDNIYLELGSKKAQGYCERNVYRCADPNSPVDVSFGKYYRKSPLDWIQSITYAEKETEEQMQQRTVWKLKIPQGDTTLYMWVDDYYGVPVKIREVTNGVANEYIFEDIAFNTVDKDDLGHNFIAKSYN